MKAIIAIALLGYRNIIYIGSHFVVQAGLRLKHFFSLQSTGMSGRPHPAWFYSNFFWPCLEKWVSKACYSAKVCDGSSHLCFGGFGGEEKMKLQSFSVCPPGVREDLLQNASYHLIYRAVFSRPILCQFAAWMVEKCAGRYNLHNLSAISVPLEASLIFPLCPPAGYWTQSCVLMKTLCEWFISPATRWLACWGRWRLLGMGLDLGWFALLAW